MENIRFHITVKGIVVFKQKVLLTKRVRPSSDGLGYWELPGGGLEYGETPNEALKRELKEETGYISDDLFLVDEAYTSPGTDNSKTYIVIANNCIKTNEKNITGNELIDYGLFSEKELEYLINKNIINGAMNKLAYYNLINNVDDCNITYVNSNKKIYKKSREKRIR